ncbi:MAG: sialate O-acetylesterase, partial [Verrucomicrobiae bacterium]|nr:sialate O-acetylesterase [Verrucomicrobiae bacterium]
MKLTIIPALVLSLLVVSLPLSAKVSMPSIFGDNMVLQRNTKVAIYGTAGPDERVTVEVSWDRE